MKPSAAKRNKWQDHYTRQAKKERFPARSVYKLQEIQHKYNLIKKGDNVLDLGCFPGSWLLYAAGLTGASGRIVGLDIKPVTLKLPGHVKVVRADVFTLDAARLAAMGDDFQVVLSDMAPSTTGSTVVDATRSLALCRAAFFIAQNVLTAGGSFVCKIFQGQDFKEFSDSFRQNFNKHHIFKPRSSRKTSKEVFIIGLDFKKK